MPDAIVHDLAATTFRDGRGFIINPVPAGRGEGKYGHIHVISMRPGVVRGNHLHRETTEWFCPVDGRARCVWRDDSGEAREILLDVDHPATVEFPPGTPHAVEGAGGGTSILVVYQDRPFDPDGGDTERVEVI